MCEVLVAKHRNGLVGTVELLFRGNCRDMRISLIVNAERKRRRGASRRWAGQATVTSFSIAFEYLTVLPPFRWRAPSLWGRSGGPQGV